MVSEHVEIYEGEGVAYSSAGGGMLFSLATPGTRGASPIPSTVPSGAPTGVAPWGTGNDFPQRVLEALANNPTMANALSEKASRLTSGDFCYGVIKIDPETGEVRRIRRKDKRVEAWLRRANLGYYLRHAPLEYARFWNLYPELIVSNDRSEILRIVVQESSFTRLGVQNAKGDIDTAYISAEWDKSPPADKCIRLAVLDPEAYDREELVRSGKPFSYIYPLKGPDSGAIYYHRAPWHALLQHDSWLDLANRIPRFKVALLKNQMTIKYHVKVPDWWWLSKYPDWELKPQLKTARRQKELDEFNKFVVGETNAGRSLMTTFKTDEQGKAYDGWSIEPIDDKLKGGQYIEDSQEAYSHLFFALGVDPSLIGATPGKGMGAGSGSDKRVADDIAEKAAQPHQRLLLEPLDFIFSYNGFVDEEGLPYATWFETLKVQTLDTGKRLAKTEPAAPTA